MKPQYDKVVKIIRSINNVSSRYSVPGVDYASGTDIIAENVPCCIIEESSSLKGSKYGENKVVSPTMYCPVSFLGSIKTGDVIENDTEKYKISSSRAGKIYLVCQIEKLS